MIKKECLVRRRVGFSLVGVLVASVIMGILAVAFTQMISNSQKGQKAVENNLDFDILKASIAMVLNQPSLCATAFKNSETPATPAQFKNPLSSVPVGKRLDSIVLGTSVIAKTGISLGGGLKVERLELRNIGPVPGPPNNFQVELIVEAKKASGSFGGTLLTNASNPFRINIQTHPTTDEIIGCGDQPLRFMTCTNAQSSAGPSAVPECLAAAANAGRGTLTGPIKAAPINCTAAWTGGGRYAGHMGFAGSWSTFGSTAAACDDGSVLIATW